MNTPKRKELCPCGSGKKYKNCCQQSDTVLAAKKQFQSTANNRALQHALELHQAGNLTAAQAIYQEILLTEPDHPDALHLLGLLSHQEGNNSIAIELINKAIRLNPAFPAYFNSLGNALKAQGKLETAIEQYQKALQLNPNYVEAHYNLGNALKDKGELTGAVEKYRLAIMLKPEYVDAWGNSGDALREQGEFAAAMGHYLRALSLRHNDYEIINKLGIVCQDLGRVADAIEYFYRGIDIKPDEVEAHYNLANILKLRGDFEEALNHYHQVLFLQPDYFRAHNNLGLLHLNRGDLDKAIEYFFNALKLNPKFVEALNNLGIAQYQKGLYSEAAENLDQALKLKPDYAEAFSNLGNICAAQGKTQEAVEYYLQAIENKPNAGTARNNLLFLYSYKNLLKPEDYLLFARDWERACVPEQDRMEALHRPFNHLPIMGRRLRVGYVSGDFCQHAVSYFVEQLFTHHDRALIELFAYSTHNLQDAVTLRLQALTEHWVSLAGLADAASLKRIEADKIDVLIDLSGFTGHNRMGVFARRAAPVQAHYLGFMASTGLTEMDYWIGDEMLTPTETDHHFSEKVWRLPRVWVCYDGKKEAPLPAWQPDDNGVIWLGSFNNLWKLNSATLSLWVKVLNALPLAKLLLKTRELNNPGNRQRILDTMFSLGIAAERIELLDNSTTSDWVNHMACYDRLDIALDPIEGISGGTTTCDALWMGVPVITLLGDRMSSRMTASMLQAIDHPDWISLSETDYIEKVVALASAVELRKNLRFTQRQSMAASPLCDAKGLAKSLEFAYFDMFNRYTQRINLPLQSPDDRVELLPGKQQEALEFHPADCFAEAETLYKKTLAIGPEDYINSTFTEKKQEQSRSIKQLLEEAIKQHQDGNLTQADASYRHILLLEPRHADALHLSGLVAHQLGRNENAIELIGKAIKSDPSSILYLENLGTILLDQDKLNEADEIYHQALVLNPDHVEANFKLGNVYQKQGKFEAAALQYSKVLAFKPNHAEVHHNFGTLLQELGQFDEAILHYQQALLIQPDIAEAYNNLGNICKLRGQFEEACKYFEQATAINPNYFEAYNNRGFTLQDWGKLEEALNSFDQALLIKPDFVGARVNKGNILRQQGKLVAAVECFYQALQLEPDNANAYSNLLFINAYNSLLTPPDYLSLALNFEQTCLTIQERQDAHNRTFSRLPLGQRRLKIGYVSGDFRQHAISYFVEQLFIHHDRTQVELFAYTTYAHQDEMTQRIQSVAEHWVSLVGLNDLDVLKRIEADGIDVLIDLSGHTANNRLRAFALRAAPVQAHYLGFMASTGLTEMDYWIGDGVLTPLETDSHFSEQVWRLPRVWVCYNGKMDAPLSEWQPDPEGIAWLGSFNNLGKLTPATLALWAKILHVLPQARLLLKTRELRDQSNRQRILSAFSNLGILPERIELQDSVTTPDWSSHMAYYNRMDIALDPVAAIGGGTTSCDALWMGVPVITLEGDRMASRMTASMLNAIGQAEWIAHSEEEYLDKVVALARDLPLRRTLRLGQREMMAASTLCDARSLVKALEQGYREMFERWQTQ